MAALLIREVCCLKRIFRLFTVLTLIAVVSLGVFGAIYRTSYTNISKQADYLEHLQVAEMPEIIADNCCAQLRNVLPTMPFIFRVTVVGDIEHMFSIDRQKVRIEEIYEGSEGEIGEEIYLTSRRWFLYDRKYIERGYVNIMEPGHQYLVFLSEQINALDNETQVFRLYDESFFAPVFCYSDFPRVVIRTNGTPTYVPYKEVRENEFFAETDETMRKLYNLKEDLFALYPNA